MTVEGARLMRQLRLEIAFRQPVPLLDPPQDVQAGNRLRDTLAPDPGQKCLAVQGLSQANYGAVELPVTVTEPAHMVDECILKACRIGSRLELRIRKWADRLWRRTALRRCVPGKNPVGRSAFRFSGRGNWRCPYDCFSFAHPGILLAGGASSLTGGAFSHRVIASSAGRNCFLSSAVISSSTPQASPIAVQSRWPFRIGGRFP